MVFYVVTCLAFLKPDVLWPAQYAQPAFVQGHSGQFVMVSFHLFVCPLCLDLTF